MIPGLRRVDTPRTHGTCKRFGADLRRVERQVDTRQPMCSTTPPKALYQAEWLNGGDPLAVCDAVGAWIERNR